MRLEEESSMVYIMRGFQVPHLKRYTAAFEVCQLTEHIYHLFSGITSEVVQPKAVGAHRCFGKKRSFCGSTRRTGPTTSSCSERNSPSRLDISIGVSSIQTLYNITFLKERTSYRIESSICTAAQFAYARLAHTNAARRPVA